MLQSQGRDRIDVAASQGMPRIVRSPRNQEGGMEQLLSQALERSVASGTVSECIVIMLSHPVWDDWENPLWQFYETNRSHMLPPHKYLMQTI